jgi:hypothetical protein
MNGETVYQFHDDPAKALANAQFDIPVYRDADVHAYRASAVGRPSA